LIGSLQVLAEKALTVHRGYGDKIQLAQDYGFLAEVALEQSRWKEANQLAEQALQILSNIQNIQPNEQGLYRFLLGRAQEHLGQVQEAIDNLKQASQEIAPQYDPELYIDILDKLRSLYFEQGQYLEAFKIKQNQRSIEQQYGFRAFIGAGHLHPQRYSINSALTQVDKLANVAQEIEASGRQQDVNRLIERISRSDHKLIVIHGQSGVGKSSIVKAGLEPALKQQAIGDRDALPIVLRVYTNWVRELGRVIAEELEVTRGVKLPAPLDSVEAIAEQLRKNEARNLLTVLIFDQFEEFFFVFTEKTEWQPFFMFLQDCLNIGFVKVILSLREDYLHYLLEAERFIKLDAINNNILDKNIRYYLGNFSPEDARAVIQSLTERSQFYLEPKLIDELVKDLAGELGEIRPIELQVVGVQLQTDDITTLEKYHQLGPKQRLVGRFIEEVIRDCGSENERAARLVLFLLTDEKGTRPLKTQTELAADLAEEANKLNLVLKIFVMSGLVLLLPEIPAERYQLVHDYLVSFIRQQQGADLLAELAELRRREEQSQVEIEQLRGELREKELLEELAKEQEQRKLTEEELKRAEQTNRILAEAQQKARRRIRRGSAILSLCLAVATTVGVLAISASQRLYEAQKGTKLEQEAANAWQRFQSGQEIWALVSAIRSGKELKELVGNRRPLEDYPATNPLFVLQKMLYDIRQQNQFDGHQKGVNSVSFSPNGLHFASASDDGTVQLWNLSGKPLIKIPAHPKPIKSVSFSRDGERIATGSEDGTARLWNLSGKKLVEFRHPGKVLSVSLSPDGQHLATAGEQGKVTLWNLSGKLLFEFKKQPGVVKSVSFSPNGQLLATAGEQGKVTLWNLKGQLLQEFPGYWQQCKLIGRPQCRIMSVSFSPDGERLVTGGYDNMVRLWNLKGKQLTQFNSEWGAVLSVSFSPNGKRLVTTGEDGTTRLWDIEKGEQLAKFTGNIEGITSVRSASFSPDGQRIVTGDKGGTIRLWNLNDKQQTKFTAHPNPKVNTIVSSVSFSPNGQHLATAALEGNETKGYEGTARLWNLKGQQLQEFKGHKGGALSVSFSSDGQRLATAGADGIARLWNLKGQLLQEFKGHKDEIRSVTFSPNGQLLATASKDKTARLWNLKGQQLAEFMGHEEMLRSVSFSPDGQRVATASEDGTARLWNLNGQQLAKYTGHKDGVMSMNFSPNGQRLVTGGFDGTVRLWNLKGEELEKFNAYHGWVMSVSFSPDGQRLTTAGQDGTVRLWNLNGQQLAEFTGHKARVWSVSFSSDGQHLTTAGDDGTVRLWRVEGLDELLARGCDWVRDYLDNKPPRR
jgi:WD40 repeat protein